MENQHEDAAPRLALQLRELYTEIEITKQAHKEWLRVIWSEGFKTEILDSIFVVQLEGRN